MEFGWRRMRSTSCAKALRWELAAKAQKTPETRRRKGLERHPRGTPPTTIHHYARASSRKSMGLYERHPMDFGLPCAVDVGAGIVRCIPVGNL